jgi:HlyD family secretion protein
LSESRRVFIEVGINNEDDIEIVSGLSEGDVVLLPAVSAGSGNQGMQRGFVGGGFFPGGPAIAPPGGGFRGGGGRP